MKETIILEKVKVGDASAFSLLYDLYWLKVYNFRDFILLRLPRFQK